GLIGTEDRETPADAAVVTNRNAGEHWLGCANYIPARRDEVHDVADARQANVAVRIVGQNDLPARSELPAHHPVVAAWRVLLRAEVQRGQRTAPLLVLRQQRGPHVVGAEHSQRAISVWIELLEIDSFRNFECAHGLELRTAIRFVRAIFRNTVREVE